MSSMFIWNDEWLAQSTETAIEPERRIVDPHHHLWNGRSGRADYLVPDLHGDTGAGHHVVATVFVECAWGYRPDGPEALRPVGETEHVLAAAEAFRGRGAEVAGIVSFADLAQGDAAGEVLDAHIAAGGGRFRGIRHVTAADPDPRVRVSHTFPPPQLLLDPTFGRGIAQLTARGLVFDAWLYHPQIPELTALARAHPEQRFVLDHLGGPIGHGPYEGCRDEVLRGWRRDLAELATCPNVSMKLGGIGMTTFGMGYEHGAVPPSSDVMASDWRDPIRFVIEHFGVERCMFESNFPVDRVSCPYVVLWNAFKKIVADCSEAEKAALFHDTAASFYDLRI